MPVFEGAHPLTGELADALGRWMARFSSPYDRRCSQQRKLLFGVAPYELGVEPGATEVWDAARAGWCWREVRPAAPAFLEGPPLQAWALELARGEPSDDLEEAFLATTELREPVAADDRARFAFRYGVALHDVERVMAEHGQRYW
jgi:hypothetical protein